MRGSFYSNQAISKRSEDTSLTEKKKKKNSVILAFPCFALEEEQSKPEPVWGDWIEVLGRLVIFR